MKIVAISGTDTTAPASPWPTLLILGVVAAIFIGTLNIKGNKEKA